MALPSEHLDNARKHDSVAHLVSFCERLISRGGLNPFDEQRLRELANDTCIAHGMNSIAERAAPIIQVGDHTPERSVA